IAAAHCTHELADIWQTGTDAGFAEETNRLIDVLHRGVRGACIQEALPPRLPERRTPCRRGQPHALAVRLLYVDEEGFGSSIRVRDQRGDLILGHGDCGLCGEARQDPL